MHSLVLEKSNFKIQEIVCWVRIKVSKYLDYFKDQISIKLILITVKTSQYY